LIDPFKANAKSFEWLDNYLAWLFVNKNLKISHYLDAA